jgi:hypothetical protein
VVGKYRALTSYDLDNFQIRGEYGATIHSPFFKSPYVSNYLTTDSSDGGQLPIKNRQNIEYQRQMKLTFFAFLWVKVGGHVIYRLAWKGQLEGDNIAIALLTAK